MLAEQTLGQEVDIFLEHFGKKGMKWGQRSKKSKVGIVVGGYVALNAVSGVIMNKTGNAKVALIVGGAAAVTGGVIIGKLLDRRKISKMKIADLKQVPD